MSPTTEAPERVNTARRPDRHQPGTTKSVRLAGDGKDLLARLGEWAEDNDMSVNAAMLHAWREFLASRGIRPDGR